MILNLTILKVTGLLSAFALFYFFSIQETPIYDETEGQYAGAVRSMGSYFEIPTNNGVPRLQKPPLTYWLMKFSSAWIENQEYAMRVPFIIALLGLLLTTYGIAVEVMDSDRGVAAMVLLGLSFGLFIFGRMVMPEIWLSLFIALSFWAAIKALKSNSLSCCEWWWTVTWGMMGLGSFAKGFHGLFWPLTVFALARGVDLFQRERWRGFWKGRNLILFCAITVPWYCVVESKYPGFIWDNLWNEQMGHSLDFRYPLTYSRVSLIHFLFQHLFLLFPVILLIPHALKSFDLTEDLVEQRELRKLLLLLPVVVLVTTLFSARQDYYTMSSWFAVSILGVLGIHSRSRSGWLAFPFWYFLGLGFFLLILGGIWKGSNQAVFRSDATDHLFSIFFQLPIEIRPLFFLAGGTLLGGGFVGLFLMRKGGKTFIVLPFMIAMFGPLWGASQGVKILSDSFSLKKMAKVVPSIPHSSVVVDGSAPLASSLFYYLDERIDFVRANAEAEFATRRYGLGRGHYWELNDLIARWKSEQNLLLIIHEKDREFWKAAMGENFVEVVKGRSGGRILIKNHPL